MSEEQKLSRRNFLSLATLAIGGLISTALVIPAIAYILGPTLQSQKTQEWIPLGSTKKIGLSTPTLFKANIQKQTGWIQSDQEISAYCLTEDGRTFLAISNICTHLGCHVRWITEQQSFYCPCHNGIFDKEGNVVSGPPPRPLDRYEVKVENDQLFIKVG